MGVGYHRVYLYGNQGKPCGEDMIYELSSEWWEEASNVRIPGKSILGRGKK